MAGKVNHRMTYEDKCVSRLKALAESRGIIVHGTLWGTLGTDRSCCVLIEPGVPAEKVRELYHDAQKCFRRASVRMGNGASLPYAPEIIYPTIYFTQILLEDEYNLPDVFVSCADENDNDDITEE